MFISDLRIAGKCKYYILTVAAYISHTCKRFTLCITVYATQIREIVIVRICPGKPYFHVLIRILSTFRPCFVIRVITIHDINSPVRSSKFSQNIILIDIKASLASVRKVNCTCSRCNTYTFNLAHQTHLIIIYWNFL